MRLKKIIIHGFKSFADRVTVDFSEGITAIVGPNGCGKSNVSDAFRWVMGEQSAKSMRGGKMPDVIFAGTSTRKPMNFAEVTLVLTDIQGALPVEYDEVAITRRLHRSGESEYLINRNQVRLKDIQSLFLDSGVGKKSFSIFEQGKIDEVINLGPMERRKIFEEAAGILRFLDRKREALRKLKQTDENMNRVLDIHKEVEDQIKVLEKQAEQARRFKESQGELAKLEKAVAVGKYDQLDEKIANAMEKEVALKDKIAEGQAKGEALVRELKETKATLEEQEIQFRRQSEEVYQRRSTKTIKLKEKQTNEERLRESGVRGGKMKQELESILMDRQAMSSKLDLARKEKGKVDASFEAAEEVIQHAQEGLQELDREVAEMRDRQQTLQHERVRVLQEETRVHGELQQDKVRLESAESRLEVVEQQRKKFSGKLEELNAAAVDRQKDVDYASVTVDDHKKRLEKIDVDHTAAKEKSEVAQKEQEGMILKMAETQARLRTLKRLQEEMEGFSNGAKELLKAAELKGKVKGLYELVRAKEGSESLLAASMRAYSFTLATTTEQDFKAVLAYAEKHNLSDYSIVCLEHLSQERVEGDALIERVTGEEGSSAALGSVAVASDLDAALMLARGTRGVEVVTEEGAYIDSRGVLFFSTAAENNLFLRAAEINLLAEELIALEKREKELEAELDALFQKQMELSQQRSTLDRELRQGEMRLVEVNFALQQAKKEQSQVQAEFDRLDEEEASLQRELKQLRERIQTGSELAEELACKNKSVQEEAASIESELRKQSMLLEEMRRSFSAKDAAFRQVTEQRRELGHEIHLLDVKITQGQEREEALQEELDQLQQVQNNAETRDSSFDKEVAEVDEALSVAEAAQAKLEKEVSDQKQKIEETDEKLKALQERLSTRMEEAHKVTVKLAERRSAQDAVENDLYERHNLTIDDIREMEIELEMPLEEAEKRMKYFEVI